jgi:uncharacterized protein involved in exopolysaccharide biosynthesis
MARAPQKDLLSRLTEAGEAAIKSIGEVPGADRFLGAANVLKDRLDELQKRVRGLENLEQRLAELERKVDRLAKGSTSSSSSRKTSTARKTTTKSSGSGTRKKTGTSRR